MTRLPAALLVVFACSRTVAQDFPSPEPTEAHEVLAREVGTWDADIKLYLQGPDNPPMESNGVDKVHLVKGGLFTRSHFQATFGERDFEGHSLVGYDPRTKEYTGTWVDNFSSVPAPLKGTYDSDSKTLTLMSTVYEPNSGQEFQQKQVTTFVNETTRKFEIFIVAEANQQSVDVKVLEMTLNKRE